MEGGLLQSEARYICHSFRAIKGCNGGLLARSEHGTEGLFQRLRFTPPLECRQMKARGVSLGEVANCIIEFGPQFFAWMNHLVDNVHDGARKPNVSN